MSKSATPSLEQLLDWAPFSRADLLAAHLSRGRYRPAPHHVLLAKLIERAVYGKDVRAIVSMPPRHGKSYMVSYWGPVWALASKPEMRIVIASYAAEFARTWGRRIRNTVEEYSGYLGVEVAQDSSAAHQWNTGVEEGGVVCAGVDGQITGKGVDLLVIDDPIKNAEEARSETYRERAWGFWTETAHTRLEPGASVIVTMTRWHEDDLVGRLVREGGWEVVSLPALAEEGDPLGRKVGEALWPEQYPADCEKFREAQRYARTWAALYQQRPSPAEGTVFKSRHFRYFRDDGPLYVLELPDGGTRTVVKDQCWELQTADTALEAKSENDYTAVTTWAILPDPLESRPPEMLLLDVRREHLEVPDQWPYLVAARRDYPRVAWQGVEKKGSGHGLIQEAQRRGMPLRVLEADRDKITRAASLAMAYEAGRVYHLRGAPWLETYEDELLGFPNAAHDDMVDCAAYAAREVGAPPTAVYIL